jgi:hypothetical protein
MIAFRLMALLVLALSLSALQAQRPHSLQRRMIPGGSPSVQHKVSASVCDTVPYGFRLPSFSLYSPQEGWGYASGHNFYGDKAFAERYDNLNGFTEVYGATFQFAIASAASPASKVSVKVWPEVSGQPGAPLYAQDLLIETIIRDTGLVPVSFPSPVIVDGPFYVGFEVSYVPGDTVAVYVTDDSTSYPATTWGQFSDGQWVRFDEVAAWGLYVSSAMHPWVRSGNFPVTLLPENPTILPGESVQLGVTGGATYLWFPQSTLSCSTCAKPLANPMVTTTYTVTAWDSTNSCSVLASTTVHVNSITAIEDGLFGKSASVYPNPGNGQVMLDFEQLKAANLGITLTDVNGRVLHEENLPDFQGKFHRAIEVGGFSKGTYFLKVTDGNQRFVRELIVR